MSTVEQVETVKIAPWRIPLAIVFSMLMQAFIAVWFAAHLDARVAENTKDIQTTSKKLETIYTDGTRYARETLGDVTRDLKDIKRILERNSRN